MKLRQSDLCLASLLSIVVLVGCGDSNVGRVSGVVTYQGKPVPGLEVEFNPVGAGRSSIGFTNTTGEYDLHYTLHTSGALVGEHVVRVSFPPGSKPSFRIPPQYGGKSELKFEVKPGKSEFDIAMEPKS